MTLALPMALAWRTAWVQSDVREWVRSGVARDANGSVSAVFGMAARPRPGRAQSEGFA